MKIIQIIPASPEAKVIYGLGDDNNVYRWEWKERGWAQTWPSEEKQATVFIPPIQPSGILGIRKGNFN
jgi:hypothetical protein